MLKMLRIGPVSLQCKWNQGQSHNQAHAFYKSHLFDQEYTYQQYSDQDQAHAYTDHGNNDTKEAIDNFEALFVATFDYRASAKNINTYKWYQNLNIDGNEVESMFVHNIHNQVGYVRAYALFSADNESDDNDISTVGINDLLAVGFWNENNISRTKYIYDPFLNEHPILSSGDNQ